MLKRFFFTLLVTAAMFLVSGCAGMMSKIPTQDELQGVRGMSKEAVLQKFGQPSDKSKDGNVWYYKKPTNNAINNFTSIGSFGLLGGDRSVIKDIAKVTFKNGKVSSTEIMLANYDFNISSMGLASDYVSDLDVPYQRDSNGSSEMKTAKNIVSSAASGMGLGSMMPSGFSADTSRSKEKPTAKSNPTDNSSFRHANLFTGCSLKDAKTRLCNNARKVGLSAELKKDGKVVITSPQGTKVATSFKPVGKDVVVELSATGPSDLSQDLCKAVEKCN